MAPQAPPDPDTPEKPKKPSTGPYGCTDDKCNEKFDHEQDWVNHEVGHSKPPKWRCDFADPRSRIGVCARQYFAEAPFARHLLRHGLGYSEMRMKLKTCEIGCNWQRLWWCGFCREHRPVTVGQFKAWDERFQHLKHHFRNGQRIEFWYPGHGDIPKGELWGFGTAATRTRSKTKPPPPPPCKPSPSVAMVSTSPPPDISRLGRPLAPSPPKYYAPTGPRVQDGPARQPAQRRARKFLRRSNARNTLPLHPTGFAPGSQPMPSPRPPIPSPYWQPFMSSSGPSYPPPYPPPTSLEWTQPTPPPSAPGYMSSYPPSFEHSMPASMTPNSSAPAAPYLNGESYDVWQGYNDPCMACDEVSASYNWQFHELYGGTHYLHGVPNDAYQYHGMEAPRGGLPMMGGPPGMAGPPPGRPQMPGWFYGGY